MAAPLALLVWLASCAAALPSPSPPPAPTPLDAFRANESLLGARVLCSAAERECLRHNRVLEPASGACVRVGARGPCAAPLAFLLDRAAFEARGRLEGACADPGRCGRGRFRMAADGRCYAAREVFGALCDAGAGAAAWPYLFGGGYECVCDAPGCPPAAYVQQPTEPGECRFPNLRKDLSAGFLPRLPPHPLRCSAAHAWCFGHGRAAFGADGRCHALLQRGPCAPRHVLVLDRQQAERAGKVASLCVPEQRCPDGFRFLAQRQRCVNETKIKNVLCPQLSTFTDVFGETVCRFQEEFYKVELSSPQDGLCSLRYDVELRGFQEEKKPDCTDPLECLSSKEMDPDDFEEA